MGCFDVPQCLVAFPSLDVVFCLTDLSLQDRVCIVEVLLVHLKDEVSVSFILLLSILVVLLSEFFISRGFYLLQAANDLNLVMELLVPIGSCFSNGWI